MNMISRTQPKLIRKIIGFLSFWIIALLSVNAPAGEKANIKQKLLVGTMSIPPVAMKTSDGSWEGLSIELLDMVARDLGVEYELVEFGNFDQILEAVEKGKLDAVTALAVTAPRESIVDFSHPFLSSGSAIAVPAAVSRPGLLHFAGHFADRIVSGDFLMVIALLVIYSLSAGALVWLFERQIKNIMFSGKGLRGLWQGLWWAMVTMTTVGYGDKAPKSVGGRIVALIWMYASIFIIAGVTAAITASFTVGELSGKVRGLDDLYYVRVGTVPHSQTSNFLKQHGISAQPFKNEKEGLQAMIDGKIDAFVHNEILLRHISNSLFSGRVHVLPTLFDHYYVSFSFPQDSALSESFNRSLLKVLDTDDYIRLKERYIGPDR